MRLAAAPRWAISFADLGLLLLGCFVLLHAMEAARPKASTGAAAATSSGARGSYAAADLFEHGEARLTDRARVMLADIGRASGGRNVSIVSSGTGEAGSRFDRFELAAARSAAVARALREAGVEESRISLTVQQGIVSDGQRIEIARR